MEIVGIIFVLLIMGATFFFFIRSQRKWDALWKVAAKELGLQMGGPTSVGGIYEGFPLLAKAYTVVERANHQDHHVTYVQMEIRGKWPSDIQIGSEISLGLFLPKKQADWEVGDPSFDRLAEILGEPLHLMGLLSFENRCLLADALAKEWTIVGNELRLLTTKRREPPKDSILFGIRLAKALSKPFENLQEALFLRATEDPYESVKEAALSILHAHFPKSSESKKANVTSLLSSNPRMRSSAAAYLGKFDVLAKVAISGAEASESRVHALNLYALHGGQEGLDELSQSLIEDYETLDVTVQEAFLSFLGAYPKSPHEDFLLSRLDLEKGELRLAVMESLGKIGSIANSVPKLLEIRDHGLFRQSKERSHAKEAILAIQSRSGHTQEGQLSMVDTSSAGGIDIVEP